MKRFILLLIILITIPLLATALKLGAFMHLKSENVSWGDPIEDLVKGVPGKYRYGTYLGDKEKYIKKNEYGVPVIYWEDVPDAEGIERVRVPAENYYLQGFKSFAFKDYYYQNGGLVAVEYTVRLEPYSDESYREMNLYEPYISAYNVEIILRAYCSDVHHYISLNHKTDPIYDWFLYREYEKNNYKSLLAKLNETFQERPYGLFEVLYDYYNRQALIENELVVQDRYLEKIALYTVWETDDYYIFFTRGFRPTYDENNKYMKRWGPMYYVLLQSKDIEYKYKSELLNARKMFDSRRQPIIGYTYEWIRFLNENTKY